LQTELTFEALLLCNGLVVARAPLTLLSAGLVDRQVNSTTGFGASHSIQELECEARFTVPLYVPSSLAFTPSPLLYCGTQSAIHPSLPSSHPLVRPTPDSLILFGIPWPETTLLDAHTLDGLGAALGNKTKHSSKG
jgi:hypothetical protein